MTHRSPADMRRWADPTKRGNCLCFATNWKCRKILRQKGVEGIVYDGFEPLLEPVSESTVSIQHMTQERKNCGPAGDPDQIEGNFEQADFETALRWTEQQKDGRTWTAVDVRKYREANELTWHERWDGHTMDLVPTCIHDHFRHNGFVAIRKDVDRISQQLEQNPDPAQDMDSWAASEYDPETDQILETEPESEPSGGNGGYCPLHLISTVGLLLLFAGTALFSDCSSLLRTVLWLVASMVPYVALPIVCLKWKGVMRFFRSKWGGIVLLTLFAVTHLLVPMLTELLFGVCAAAAAFVVLKMVSAFGPNGTLTITRENADGSTSTETRAFYGSAEEAVARAEHDLRAEGYDDIRRGG